MIVTHPSNSAQDATPSHAKAARDGDPEWGTHSHNGLLLPTLRKSLRVGHPQLWSGKDGPPAHKERSDCGRAYRAGERDDER